MCHWSNLSLLWCTIGSCKNFRKTRALGSHSKELNQTEAKVWPLASFNDSLGYWTCSHNWELLVKENGKQGMFKGWLGMLVRGDALVWHVHSPESDPHCLENRDCLSCSLPGSSRPQKCLEPLCLLLLLSLIQLLWRSTCLMAFFVLFLTSVIPYFKTQSN